MNCKVHSDFLGIHSWWKENIIESVYKKRARRSKLFQKHILCFLVHLNHSCTFFEILFKKASSFLPCLWEKHLISNQDSHLVNVHSTNFNEFFKSPLTQERKLIAGPLKCTLFSLFWMRRSKNSVQIIHLVIKEQTKTIDFPNAFPVFQLEKGYYHF